MSYEAENCRYGTDPAKAAKTSFDPRDPIEVTKAEGTNVNDGTTQTTPPSEADEDSAPTTGE